MNFRYEYLRCLNPAGFHDIATTVWDAGNNARPAICAHGFSRTGRDFDALAAALAADRPVYCPDTAGRGRSGWLADRNLYNYDQYMRDAATLIGHVTARVDADDARGVDWIGTSMGGMLGMMLAAQPNTPVRRLVLNDIGPRIGAAAVNAIGEYLCREHVFDALDEYQAYLMDIYAGFGDLSDAQWRHLAAHSCREVDGRIVPHYDPQIASAFEQTAEQDIEVWELWGAVSVPTLVLRGAESQLLAPETAEEMVAMRPDTRVVEIQGAGHAPALMSDREIGIVRDFVAAEDSS